jgi:hypothetical protein
MPPNMVPRAAVDAMCSRMKSEGINTELRVVKTSQPLITPQAMAALASAMFFNGRGQTNMSVAPSVPVQTAGSCVSRSIDTVTSSDADVMVVEFSSPFTNPFARNQLGVLARVSLGNESPSWYWIPIGQNGNGIWGASSPIMISLRE